MNVFVLNAGRCGSTTFAQACNHIENYTSGHETRTNKVNGRLNYPNDHIEIDNHLTFMLGRLDKVYGNDACYVHLKRNLKQNAKSWIRKERKYKRKGRIWFYKQQIITDGNRIDELEVAKHYCITANKNIEHYLKDKERKMTINIENAKSRMEKFYKFIGAKGNIKKSKKEVRNKYNRIDSIGAITKIKNKIYKKLF